MVGSSSHNKIGNALDVDAARSNQLIGPHRTADGEVRPRTGLAELSGRTNPPLAVSPACTRHRPANRPAFSRSIGIGRDSDRRACVPLYRVAVSGRHEKITADARRWIDDRSRTHPRRRSADTVCLHPSRLHVGLRLLPDRYHGSQAQSQSP